MSFLSNLMGSKKKVGSVIGLDIGSSSLKVVQVRKQRGAAVLETYGELSLGPYGGAEVGQATNLPADKIAETLRDLLRESNITTLDAGVSIPFSRSLLTLVELPRAKTPEEQKTIVELEARKYIPVPVSEVQLDWFIVPDPAPEGAQAKEVSQKVRVLIVAVHNDELALLQNVVKGAGLAADFFEIEIFSTIRSVVDEPIQPVMVLDIGASATKVYVVEHGVVALSHNIPQGGQDVTHTISTASNLPIAKAESLKKENGFNIVPGSYSRETIESVFSHIFEEAKRAQVQYETQHGKPIACIILTGGGGVTKELGAYARQFFSVEVRIADPFAKTQAPAFMRPVLQQIGPEFAVAVGLALRKLENI
jgi:type IV pilus assembly protein PilM